MKPVILFFFLTISVRVFAPLSQAGESIYIMDLIQESELKYEITRLWKAACIVESGGNPLKINQDEQAYGIVQIRQIRLDDYYRRTGKKYTLPEMLDTLKSREVYMYYAKGSKIDYIAKRWNGSGPMTEIYWKKIRRQLAG